MKKIAPTTHTLKTLGLYWDALEAETKTFEVRRDDCGFQRGDLLILRRMRDAHPTQFDSPPGGYGYRELRRRVLYVLTGGQLGIEPGYVVMGLEKAS